MKALSAVLSIIALVTLGIGVSTALNSPNKMNSSDYLLVGVFLFIFAQILLVKIGGSNGQNNNEKSTMSGPG
jgi:hypothetical protein